jgi:hypothetical protein
MSCLVVDPSHRISGRRGEDPCPQALVVHSNICWADEWSPLSPRLATVVNFVVTGPVPFLLQLAKGPRK